MAIYTNGGATIEIVESYKEYADRGCWLVRAKRTSAYPDGSGADSIGEIIHETDRKTKGWSPLWDYRHDGEDPQEMHKAADKAPDGKPDNPEFLLNYFWPRMFDKKGKPIYETRNAS